MNADLAALSATAVSLGFFHTLLGPDHYVPFVAMARAGRWSRRKTLVVTLLCGLAHVGSSVLLGLVGLALGLLVFQLETVESQRGSVAGWLLIGFGVAYTSWGVVQAVRNRPHAHPHAHPDGTVHVHEHVHFGEHLHPHAAAAAPATPPAGVSDAGGAGNAPAPATTAPSLTPWILFTIFAFGPCEPLIPLLMYPAAQADMTSVACVSLLFSVTTIATMTAMVTFVAVGASAVRFDKLARFSHALAGAFVLSCGLAVKMGL